jgi:hypothetical protein
LRSAIVSSFARLANGAKHTNIKSIWTLLFIAYKLLPGNQTRQRRNAFKVPPAEPRAKFIESILAENTG